MSEFKQYKRKGLSEMRPYIFGENLNKVSVASVDNPEIDMGMVARNPENHSDQWYVAKKYFNANLELVDKLALTKKQKGEFDISLREASNLPYHQVNPCEAPIMRYFAYEHLPEKLQKVSKPICDVAREYNESVRECAEKSAGLRKLLEAKDCMVRASL